MPTLYAQEQRLLAACQPTSPARSCLGVLAAVSAVSRLGHPSPEPATPADPPQEGRAGDGGTRDTGGDCIGVLPGGLQQVLPGVLARAAVGFDATEVEEHGRRWVREVTVCLLLRHPGLLGPLLKQLPLLAVENGR